MTDTDTIWLLIEAATVHAGRPWWHRVRAWFTGELFSECGCLDVARSSLGGVS